MKKENEYEKFDKTMQQLLKVPHADVKAKLEAERDKKKDKKAAGGRGKAISP